MTEETELERLRRENNVLRSQQPKASADQVRALIAAALRQEGFGE